MPVTGTSVQQQAPGPPPSRSPDPASHAACGSTSSPSHGHGGASTRGISTAPQATPNVAVPVNNIGARRKQSDLDIAALEKEIALLEVR